MQVKKHFALNCRLHVIKQVCSKQSLDSKASFAKASYALNCRLEVKLVCSKQSLDSKASFAKAKFCSKISVGSKASLL